MAHTEKLNKIKDFFLSAGSVLVAYSGGVDSSLLLKIGTDTLGPARCAGVTLDWEVVTEEEKEIAQNIATRHGFTHIFKPLDCLELKEFKENTPMRCYVCKKHLFTFLKDFARQKRFAAVAEGSNVDDYQDFRPGRKALEELGIESPLADAGMTKQDIRESAKEIGLENWGRSSAACLASRLPYGTPITVSSLEMVKEAEQFLRLFNLNQVRVRHHNQIARIEVTPEDLQKLMDDDVREAIVSKCKDLGFAYATIDLQGYRTGSMNEPLSMTPYPG